MQPEALEPSVRINNKPSAGVHLPNLDSLRAIAALMVVICHIELRKPVSFPVFKPVKIWGGVGVYIFFTLSGFLITYLLLIEKERKTNINIKAFYFRRILRIWPLYFFVLLFTYVIINAFLPRMYELNERHLEWSSIVLNVFFLTNVTYVLNLTPLIISNIWSIGIEEQFYIFWPWIVKGTKAVAIKLILALIIVIPAARILTSVGAHLLHMPMLKTISQIIATSKFDIMAMGGLVTYIGYYKTVIIGRFKFTRSMIEHKKVQVFALTAFLITLVFAMANIYAEVALYLLAPSAAIIIYNLALNPASILKIETKAGNYLGKISYGLYLLHMPVIYFIYAYGQKMFLKLPAALQNPVIYILAISGTILVSAISYKFLESPFLKLKSKLSYVKTN